jgi:ribosomal protein S6--L-glutamate ligase
MTFPTDRRLVALVSGLGWHVQDLLRAAPRVGVGLTPVPFASVTGRVGTGTPALAAGGVDLAAADGVLVRMMPPGTLEGVVFRMDALHRLVAAGVPVLNPPAAVEAAVDKYLATARLDAAGLPVPPTWCGESAEAAREAFEALGGDVVVKPLFGSEGRGLVRLTDRETAGRVFHALERIGSVLYLQKFVPNPGSDLRLFVLGGRVLGAIRRHAPPGDWRANVAIGGRAEAFTPDGALVATALRAARAVGARLAGVDILPGADGTSYVIEVNAVPGWRALAAATGKDVAAAILADLRDGAGAGRDAAPGGPAHPHPPAPSPLAGEG